MYVLSNVGGLAIAIIGLFSFLISSYQNFVYDYYNIKELYWVEKEKNEIDDICENLLQAKEDREDNDPRSAMRK